MRLLSPAVGRDYRFAAAMLAGIALAAALVPLWNLPTRWFVAVLVGISMISVSFIVIERLDEFLLAAYLFLLPLAGFQKWLFIDGYDTVVREPAPLSGVISVGITEILLAGMYILWFVKIFVSRTLPWPRLEKLDIVILLFILANILSIPGASDTTLGIFAVFHLVRHFLVYFYFSRRLHARHLRWMMAAFAVAILLESTLGLFQYKTGLMRGLIFDKGAGTEKLDFQYEVPGIEDVNRATGTSYDSHSYGLFLAMLLPFALAVVLSNRNTILGWHTRLKSVALCAAGSLAVFISFSRSAWLTLVLTSALVWLVFVLRREKHIFLKTCCLVLLALIPLPAAVGYITTRFDYEGAQNLTARYDQFPAAWDMWKAHFWFGHGIGNYMIELPRYLRPGTLELPVHNVFLWIAADTGVFGAVTFYAMILVALWQLVRVIQAGRDPIDVIAIGTAAALVAYVFDGMSNPLFRESLVYMTFWLMLALSVAVPRIQREMEL